MTNQNNAAQAAEKAIRAAITLLDGDLDHENAETMRALLTKLRAPVSSIREGFELTYAADADDPACATDLFHFTNGWRACIMSQVRAPVANVPLTHRCANCGAVFQGAGCPSCRLAAPVASAPVAGEAVYTLRVRGAIQAWTPTAAAFSIPDGEHQLFLSPAAPQASEAVLTQVLAALESAQRFIRNGIEFGYIRMPDADTPDPAHRTPGLIDAAIRSLKSQADKDGGQQRAADASAPDTAKDRVDKILRERMAPISEALGLDVMLASAGNGVIRIFTFKGGPLVYTIRADGTAILRVSWNQPDAPDTLTVDQVNIISQAASETQPEPRPARAAVAGEVVGWAAVPSRGKRAGRIYCTCDTREQIDAYIEQVHQSDDSLTLWARPVSFADAAPQASAENVRDVNAAMAAEYRQWIDWFHKGRDYNSFLNECVFNKPQDNKDPA